MADLTSSWAKLDRAKEHFEVLKAQLAEATDPKKHPITFKTEYEAQPGRPIPRRQIALAEKLAGLRQVEPPPSNVTLERAVVRIDEMPAFTASHSLLLGEALNGCRSALDHLAWTLVKHHKAKLTKKQERHVGFPARAKSKNFVAECKGTHLRGVPEKPFIALAERYQPYKRSPVGRAMRLLRNLSDTDKHRFVLPIAAPMGGVALELEFEGCWQASPYLWQWWPENASITRTRTLKPSAKLYEVLILRGAGERQVTVKGHLGIYPRLPNTDLPAPDLFDQMTGICTEILSEFEALL